MRILSIVIAVLLFASTATAQKLDFSSVLNAETVDAELYLKNYINPFILGFGYGLANGWYNTAAPHGTGHFDITFTGNLAYVPNEDLFFDFVGFRTLTASNTDNLPTIFGPDAANRLTFSNTKPVTYTHPLTQEQITELTTIHGQFDAPDGLDLKAEIGSALVPVPMVQVGVGTLKNTELMVRWAPRIKTDDFAIGIWGLGVKHNIKQWIPGIRHLPFSASILMGYTGLAAETDLTSVRGGLAGAQQIASYDISVLTLQMLASKRISALSVYGSLGFNDINSTLKMTGTYIIEGTVPINGQDVPATAVLVDPLDISFASAGPRLTTGARIDLLILTLHADYTFQEYNTLTLGLGFSF